ncbi:hypothetical protein PRO82_000806 [Candidatus Protochlamydia amoebophila]|nr:hypothetical protein [Candidatus Protochlamydia amoebophila]
MSLVKKTTVVNKRLICQPFELFLVNSILISYVNKQN